MIDVNVTGPMLCCQVFGGGMAKAGRGSIVNIASIYGSRVARPEHLRVSPPPGETVLQAGGLFRLEVGA